MIDKIFYINLEYRTDRKESILKELAKLNYPENMIERVDAIKMENGAHGCALSHLKALKNAIDNDYNCVMIVEDDLAFKENINDKTFRSLLEELHTINDFNICSLGAPIYGKKILQKTKNIGQAIDIQTTTGYIIKKNFFITLYETFSYSKKCFEENKPRSVSAIDIVWKRHQNNSDGFYVFEPSIVYQIESYSDIEKYVVKYFFDPSAVYQFESYSDLKKYILN